MKTSVLTSGMMLASLASAIGVRIAVLDDRAYEVRATPREKSNMRSPGREALWMATFEHRLAAADTAWLKIVQDLGGTLDPDVRTRTSTAGEHVAYWAHLASDLDPRYYTVYWASAIHLIVYSRDPDLAEGVLEKAQRNIPSSWEWPFYRGYIEYFIRGRGLEAADWWEKAVTLPGSPHFLPSLAGRARFQAGDEGGALAILESLLEVLPDGPQRLDVQIRLKILHSEQDVLRPYDAACLRFKAEKGRVPKSGAELHDAGYIDVPPFDRLEKPITIDARCRARTEYIQVREDEAKARLGMEARTATATSIRR